MTTILVAEVKVQHREGCFHAYSEDVPGFHLCADNIEALDHDIPAALEFMFKVKHNIIVKVERAVSPSELNTPRKAKRRLSASERFVMTPAFALA